MIDPAAGFTISVSGSYRLVGDAVMAIGDVVAVLVLADDATIDLNGHTIRSDVVRGNTTWGNSSAGIDLNAGGNRRLSNACKDGIADVGGNSVGTGDAADVASF